MLSVPKSKYRLRWRYEYLTKPPKYGQWDIPGNIATEGAWRFRGPDLHWAVVEGECKLTSEIVRLAEVPAHEFMTFQWSARAMAAPIGLKDMTTPTTRLSSLDILTRNETIKVFTSGNVVKIAAPENSQLRLQSF